MRQVVSRSRVTEVRAICFPKDLQQQAVAVAALRCGFAVVPYFFLLPWLLRRSWKSLFWHRLFHSRPSKRVRCKRSRFTCLRCSLGRPSPTWQRQSSPQMPVASRPSSAHNCRLLPVLNLLRRGSSHVNSFDRRWCWSLRPMHADTYVGRSLAALRSSCRCRERERDDMKQCKQECLNNQI